MFDSTSKRTREDSGSARLRAGLAMPRVWMNLRTRLEAFGLGVLFVVIAGLAAHRRYSWMGFNPTDDGFLLAITRRVLHGDVPHRDFISIRPVGSSLIHAPFVLFGGPYTFVVDRFFVWFELATIAFLWAGLMLRAARVRPRGLPQVALAAAGMMLSAHTFPVLAWHTIDALFACTLGLVLVERRRTRLLGYALLGFAALCKQNFALMAPLVVLLRGDRRELRAWLAVGSMPALYVSWVGLHHGLPDLVEQLTAQSDLWTAGWKSFVGRPSLGLRFALGVVLGLLAFGRRLDALVDRRRGLLVAVVCIAILVEASTIFEKNEDYGAFSFDLFAMAAGVVAASMGTEDDEWWRIALVAVVLAWSTTLSMGYVMPALASAPLVSVLGSVGLRGLERGPDRRLLPHWSSAALVGVAALVLLRVDVVRHRNIYRDQQALLLTATVDHVFAGTKGIRTSVPMREFADDLRLAIEKAGPGEYAILPDLAAFWVRRPQPLVTVWPLNAELASPELHHRALVETDLRRGRITLIVAKVTVESIAGGGGQSVTEAYSDLVGEVRRAWKLVDSTRDFDIYR